MTDTDILLVMSALVPNLGDLLEQLPTASPARELVVAFQVDHATVQAQLDAIVRSWMEQAKGGTDDASSTAVA